MSERCAPDDPRRCQGTTRHGQCVYLATEGNEYCEFHNRGSQQKKNDRLEVERYIIDNVALREAYQRHGKDSGYLGMKDEIVLLQGLLERRLNAIKGDNEILMAIGPVTQLMQRLESMKTTLLKMQMQLGLVLDKDSLRRVAREIADILDDELEGLDDKYERLERISERIVVAIESAGVKEEE